MGAECATSPKEWQRTFDFSFWQSGRLIRSSKQSKAQDIKLDDKKETGNFCKEMTPFSKAKSNIFAILKLKTDIYVTCLKKNNKRRKIRKKSLDLNEQKDSNTLKTQKSRKTQKTKKSKKTQKSKNTQKTIWLKRPED